MKIKSYIIIAILLVTHFPTKAQNVNSHINLTNKKNLIDSLLNVMTITEKVGQLTQVVGRNKLNQDLIREGKIGSYLIGIDGADSANKIQQIAIEESRLGIPLIFANDVIHGYHTIFPIPLAESCSWNPELIKKASEIAAIEAASEGTHWTFAPMVDIARDPRWGRILEGSGEDTYLGSVLAKARVEGFQGSSLSHKNTLAACGKHYVAYGAAEAGKDYNTVDISERTLRDIYLPPFKAAVDANVSTLMSSFNDLNGMPASANHFTLTEILRGEWNFNGFVVSDYNSVGELVAHGIAADKKEAAEKGFLAGVDMDMVGDSIVGNIYMNNLTELVNENIISQEELNNSVSKILELKFDLGLFENPYVDEDFYINNMPSQGYKDSIALQLARESIVLLKNEKNVLPLPDNFKNIALIGPFADNQDDLLGTWACDGKPENVVTILNGIRNKKSIEIDINYAQGCEIKDSISGAIQNALNLVKSSDAAIVTVGEGKWESGEAASKTKLNIPDIQMKMLKKIKQTGTPLIVILTNGRPLTIPWIAENADAVLETWYLGDQSGNAIADVLFGNYNPSGKLTSTFPRSVGQIPIYYKVKNTGRPPTDYKYTSKYLDEEITPQYPFGFGLSYSDFNYSNLRLSTDTLRVESFSVFVEIENKSDYDGVEIVQLYIHDKVSSVAKPKKELKRFKRVKVDAKGKRKVEFKLMKDDFKSLDIDLNEIVEPGYFDIMVGGNSVDYLTEKIYIHQ